MVASTTTSTAEPQMPKTGIDREYRCVSSIRAGTPKDGTWNLAHPARLTGSVVYSNPFSTHVKQRGSCSWQVRGGPDGVRRDVRVDVD